MAKIEAGYSKPNAASKEVSKPISGEDRVKMDRNNLSMLARQIKNGWLLEESWDDEKGARQKKETYHAINPLKEPKSK